MSLWHNLNNLGRGLLDDVICNMKALGLEVSDKKMFEICIFWEFWPRDLPMQPIGNIWINLEGIKPVEFGQIPISGLGVSE